MAKSIMLCDQPGISLYVICIPKYPRVPSLFYSKSGSFFSTTASIQKIILSNNDVK